MRRLLIISPHFPPINAPDHQRVRMALPYLKEFGWHADVLSVHQDYVEGVLDPLLTHTLPEGLQVINTVALPARYTRRVGLGSLALRALPFLRSSGNELMRNNRYDLAFFSTTMFPVMSLGPYWHKKFGVPYVLDFQDPWLNDYYTSHDACSPPGGRFKYGFSQALAKYLEPYTLKRVSKVITVSPAYPLMFQKRYQWLRADQFTTIPFSAAEQDFKLISEMQISQPFFDRTDGKQHWVYVGCVGKIMDFSIRSLFTAVKQARHKEPRRWNNLKFHFIGTDYAPGDRARKSVAPIAEECGVGDMVHERPHRIPYFEALQCLRDADALIVPGSDDPGYTASKIYPYILASKPLLAIFHELSSVVPLMESTRAGVVVPFSGTTSADLEKTSKLITEKWFDFGHSHKPDTDWTAFAPYTAKEMTRKLCGCFDKAVGER